MSDGVPPRAHGQIAALAAFEKVGKFKYVLHSVLGWLSAFFCAVCVAYLSVFVPFVPFLLSVGVMSWAGPHSAAAYAVAVIVGSLFFLSGIPLGRFLLRAFPPRLTGERRNGVIYYLAILTVWFMVSMCLAIFGSSETMEPSAAGAEVQFGSLSLLKHSLAWKILVYVSAVSWWLGFAIPLLVRHLNPRRFLNAPFVLFLRRFSQFSDRTVQHAVLKFTPSGKPVAFLTPTRSRAGDWDPFRVGFSGIKLRHPIRSMPVILRSRNEDWEHAARDLIARAQVIVLDLSEGSGAIRSEIRMIDDAARWSDTMILAKRGTADSSESEHLAEMTKKGAIVILYKKNWIRALPRLFFGLFATTLVTVPLFYLVPLLGRIVATGDVEGASMGFLSAGGRLYSLFVNFIVFGWIYFVFFVRPALDRQTRIDLSQKLKSS